MTVAERLRSAVAELGPDSSTARLDAELLMADALGVSRSALLIERMREPAPERFETLFARRLVGEPVAYILGHTGFWDLELAVTPDVLIPRGDSETLIRAAQEVCADNLPSRVLDCGTGSGALLLAALRLFPEAQGVGIDRSAQALAVAADNAARNGLSERVSMASRDWDTPGWADDLGHFDLILANPPYVEDHAALEPVVREHEPAGALFAGPEGLDAYRVLVPQFRDLLTNDGVAIVEIGARQAAQVTDIAAKCGLTVDLRHDLGNRPRALILR
ncbi:MAG: peptide chain release factor N(5)-glutamine methyltransferase [Sphingomonadaceae bacterium]